MHKEDVTFIRKYWLESLLLVAAALFLLSAIGGHWMAVLGIATIPLAFRLPRGIDKLVVFFETYGLLAISILMVTRARGYLGKINAVSFADPNRFDRILRYLRKRRTLSLRIGLICFCITISLIVAFVSLGDRSLDSHETFVSVTAREMSESNEYVIPTFNGHHRLNKTPLPYWLVVVASQFTGKIDEFTARVPTAIMSVLSVICMLYFVTVLLDFRTAFLASLVWTCSLGYIRYSHSARPEMALTFFTLISFLSFYSAIEEVDRKKQIFFSLIFWISLGLSVLAKAPSSVFFIAFSAIVYLAVFKRWRQFPKILPVWGLISFLLIVLPWPIAAANAMNWDLSLWRQEALGGFTADSDQGYQEWFYYIPMIFQFIMPWVCFLPFAISAPFFKVWGSKRRVMSYLWICIFTGVIFLTFCSGTRQHYILPVMLYYSP